MSRAAALLLGLALAIGLTACDSIASQPAGTGSGPSSLRDVPGPSASSAAAIVPGCDPSAVGDTGWLTGVWEADDNGIYYLHHTAGDCIWWFGTDVGRSTGNTFANVAVGHVDGDVIQLQWSDVPMGDLLNSGILSLDVSADGNTLTQVEATGGFGGRTWTRQVDVPSPGASGAP